MDLDSTGHPDKAYSLFSDRGPHLGRSPLFFEGFDRKNTRQAIVCFRRVASLR